MGTGLRSTAASSLRAAEIRRRIVTSVTDWDNMSRTLDRCRDLIVREVDAVFADRREALEESLDDVGYSVEPPSSEAAFRLVRPKVSFCQPNRSFSQLRGRDEVDSLLPTVIVRKVRHRRRNEQAAQVSS